VRRSVRLESAGITRAQITPYLVDEPRRFFPALEAAFESDRRNFISAHARFIILRAIIIYNMALPLDFLLAPDTAWLAAALHFGVVTPMMVFAGLWTPQSRNPLVRDAPAALVPLLIIGQIMLIYHLNQHGLRQSAGADQYQYLAVIVMVYTNINQPLDVRVAVATTFALGFVYLAVLLPGPSPMAVKLVGTGLMFAAAYLSLGAKARLEVSARHAFLRRLHDRLQRVEAEDEASRDALTGLSNRRHFGERTAALWGAVPPGAGLIGMAPMAIVMIDIDHFKLFNDRYGHPAGDRCLKRVAGAIASVLRGGDDLAVRFGGEEFLLFLPDTGLEVAVQIAERVRRAIEALSIPHDGAAGGTIVTASLGVAEGPVTATVSDLLAAADEALYRAKRGGRNRVSPPFMTLEPLHPTWRSTG
jgi:diguanylate cyclase (GGDEF)-like protein